MPSAVNTQLIERYLKYCATNDEQVLVDADKLAELNERIEAAESPWERTQAVAERAKLLTDDLDQAKQDFIAEARKFVEQLSGSQREAVLQLWRDELNVGADILAAVGLVPQRARRGSTAPTRRKRVDMSDVIETLTKTYGDGTKFTVKDAIEATGASRQTVLKALELVGAEREPDPNHTGRGAKPMLYQLKG